MLSPDIMLWKLKADKVEAELAEARAQIEHWKAEALNYRQLYEGGYTAEARAQVAAKDAALRKAEQFIVNGTELGFIRMPDAGLPDTAHDTLPMIRAALAAPAQEPK